jgi:hypothetical protein
MDMKTAMEKLGRRKKEEEEGKREELVSVRLSLPHLSCYLCHLCLPPNAIS